MGGGAGTSFLCELLRNTNYAIPLFLGSVHMAVSFVYHAANAFVQRVCRV